MTPTCDGTKMVNIFIALMIVTSIVLLLFKQNVASLTTSLVVIMLVTFTMIPYESCEDGTWTYSSSGAARFLPSSQKTSPQKTSPRKTSPRKTSRMNLPSCHAPPAPPSQKEVRAYIRNHGLYGIHGNQSCRKMQRASVADKGWIEPIHARQNLLQFLAADQLHSRDSSLISKKQ